MSIVVSAPVRVRLAEIAAAVKAATGRPVSYDDVILGLLNGTGDDGAR